MTPSFAQVVTGRQQDLFSDQHSRMVNNKQQQPQIHHQQQQQQHLQQQQKQHKKVSMNSLVNYLKSII